MFHLMRNTCQCQGMFLGATSLETCRDRQKFIELNEYKIFSTGFRATIRVVVKLQKTCKK